jgi:hypothetical protein
LDEISCPSAHLQCCHGRQWDIFLDHHECHSIIAAGETSSSRAAPYYNGSELKTRSCDVPRINGCPHTRRTYPPGH